MIAYASKNFNKEHLLILYRSIFETTIRYAIMHWGKTAGYLLDSVDILRKRAIRMIAGVRFPESSIPWARKWDLLPVRELYELEMLSFVHNNKVTFGRQKIQIRELRTNGWTFNLQKWRRAASRKQCPYMGPKYYNKLPKQIKEIMHKKKFRITLKRRLLSRM